MKPVEGDKVDKRENVGKMICDKRKKEKRKRKMEKGFGRGVDEIRTDWTLSRDGTFVVLPVGTQEINLSDLN